MDVQIIVIIAVVIAFNVYNIMAHPAHMNYRAIIQPMTGIKPNPIIVPPPVVIKPSSTAIKIGPIGGVPRPAPIILPGL